MTRFKNVAYFKRIHKQLYYFKFSFWQFFFQLEGSYLRNLRKNTIIFRSVWFFKTKNFAARAVKLGQFFGIEHIHIPDRQQCARFRKLQKSAISLHPTVAEQNLAEEKTTNSGLFDPQTFRALVSQGPLD